MEETRGGALAVAATSLVRDLLSRTSADSLDQLSAAFAELGWRPTPLPTAERVSAISLSAGGEPQILVMPSLTADSARSVSLGYSHEAILTLDWGPETVRVHKSFAWRSTPGDAPLLEVASDDVTGVAQILGAVSRDQFHALAAEPTHGRHPPLAELLARAFAEFRRQVVDSELLGTGPGEVAALRLFHQLLFMRFHEDRFSAPADVRVARALDTDDLPRQLGTELQWYSRRFNSELFADLIDLSRVPHTALRAVIRELVEPWERLRLDFSVTTNEVAGRLYQSYLRLAPARIDEGRLFPGAELRSQQKSAGAYYTPAPVARFLVRETLGVWLKAEQPMRFGDIRVIDPTCGSGAFLVAAYRALLAYWTQKLGHPLSEDERSEILSASIFGVDRDAAAVMLSRVHLLEEASLADHVLPELANNVVTGDSLTGDGLPEGFLAQRSFDVVVTNPPFAAPRLAVLKNELPSVLERFTSLRGTGRNFAYAFGELALDLIRDDGRAGLVVPRALLDGPSSAAARKALGAEHLHGLLDFGRNVVFDFTLAYIAAIVVANTATDRPMTARLRDNLVPKVDVLDGLDRIVLAGESDSSTIVTAFARPDSAEFVESDSWAPFTLRWRFQLQNEIGVRTLKLGADKAPRIVIGTQTGADDLFVLKSQAYRLSDEHLVADGVVLPKRWAPSWVSGEDILPFRVSLSGDRVIIPAEGEDPAVDMFIAQRGGVPPSFRPGQLTVLRQPKVLIRNMFLEPAAAVDLDGDLMPPQGVVTALISPSGSSDELLLAEALLNSSTYQWLLQGLAHPRAGGYGRLMAHHWGDVPWPRLSKRDQARIIRASAVVRAVFDADVDDIAGHSSKGADQYWRARHALDECVFDALKASSLLRDIVSRELWRLA
jgi:hypothetical protein